ncbi:hypothetical protein J6590_019582 [Homalodisca vitripennis]|nr:hypothetical protein J6590_019582 [Homalodisca vitripennis]
MVVTAVLFDLVVVTAGLFNIFLDRRWWWRLYYGGALYFRLVVVMRAIQLFWSVVVRCIVRHSGGDCGAIQYIFGSKMVVAAVLFDLVVVAAMVVAAVFFDIVVVTAGLFNIFWIEDGGGSCIVRLSGGDCGAIQYIFGSKMVVAAVLFDLVVVAAVLFIIFDGGGGCIVRFMVAAVYSLILGRDGGAAVLFDLVVVTAGLFNIFLVEDGGGACIVRLSGGGLVYSIFWLKMVVTAVLFDILG